jgi:uncharacterized protein (TIGR02246 family)
MSSDHVVAVVTRFNDALNSRDVDGMMRLMTDDCVFENTAPPPDGSRFIGQSQVRAFWDSFFESSASATIEIEEIAALDDRCVMRWVYRWIDRAGQAGHVRGIDLYRVRDGLICEKLSYVKG